MTYSFAFSVMVVGLVLGSATAMGFRGGGGYSLRQVGQGEVGSKAERWWQWCACQQRPADEVNRCVTTVATAVWAQ